MQAKSLNAEECQYLKKPGLEAMFLLTRASYEINMQQRLPLRPRSPLITKDIALLQEDLAITAISSQKTGEATTPNLGNTKTMPTGTRHPGQANRTLTASY